MNQRSLAKSTYAAKRRSAAVLASAAANAATLALLATQVHSATLTWVGGVTDPNVATYSAGPNNLDIPQGTDLHLWNASAANWTGDSTTYTVGDDLIFTDNFVGGTVIRPTSSNLNPSSMTFVHVAGATPTTYQFIRSGDFLDASSANVSGNTPFGAGHSTILTLDTGFDGKVVLRARSGVGLAGGTSNTIVRSGILELGDGGALPNTGNNNQPTLTLAGGALYMNVKPSNNTGPASTQLGGALTVTADSVIGNNQPNNSRVWNGPINIATGATLTFQSIQANARIDLSNALFAGSTGTIRLEDVGGNVTTVALQNTRNRGAGAIWDLGIGSSELLSTTGTNTFEFGALTGGVNTKLSGSTSGGSTTTFSIGARGDSTTYFGTIRDNAGFAAITKVGTGTLTLAGPNTYTGATTVSEGTLTVSGTAGSISGSGTITVNNNALLTIDNGTNHNDRLGDVAVVTLNQGNMIFTGNLAAPTAEVAGQLDIGGGANTLQTLATASGSPASLTFASLSRIAGVIDFRPSPNVNIAFATPPTLTNGIIAGYATANTNDWATLSGSNVAVFSAYATNTLTGGWAPANNINLTSGATSTVAASKTINSLRFAGSGTTVSIGAGQSLNIGTGGILATGAGGATISGAGSLTAGSAAGAELLALVQDASNTLTISAPITDNGAGAVTLVKAGPGRLLLSGSGSTYTGGTSLIGGTLAVGVANFFPAASNLTLNYGAALDINGSNQAFGTVTIIDGSLLNSGGPASVSAAAYDVRKGTVTTSLGGTAALTKTTSGTVTLAAANTYSGGTTVSNGILVTTANGAIPNAALTVNGGGTLDIGSTSHSVGLVTIGNGTTSSGTITGTIGVLTSNTTYDAQNGTVSAILGGAVGLTKAPINTTVTLSGANTYTGPTVMGQAGTNSGTLSINSVANGGSPSAIGASSNAASNLILDFGTLIYTGTGHSTDRLFTLGGQFAITHNGTGPLNFTNPGAIAGGGNLLTLSGTGTGSIAGAIPGGGGLTKTGSGTWALSGSSSYGGNTTISGGVLSVNALANGGANSPIGSSSNSSNSLVLNGGTLQYTGSGHSTDRLFNLNNSSTLNASGTGPVNFNNSGGTIAGSINAAATLTLTGTNTGNNTLAPVIPNVNGQTTSLTKTGAGTWVLTGANTFTGATTVTGGRLVLGSAAWNVLSNAGGAAIGDDASLVFDYTATTSPAATIIPLLNTAAASDFDTGQIRSTPGDGLHGIVLTDNGVSTVTLTRAFIGDLNLDDRVNADDFALMDRGAAMGLTGWRNGDLNYSGAVDMTDYIMIDSAYGNSGVPHAAFQLLLVQRQAQFGDQYVAQLVAAVPEPSSLAAVLGLTLLPLARRRTRRD